MSRFTRGPIRTFAGLAMVLSMLYSAFGGAGLASAQTDEGEGITGVSGNTYVSPSFGYSLEWDRTWAVRDEFVEDDYNMLRLDDDGSILYIEGYATQLGPEECLTTYGLDLLEGSEGVSDLEATDPVEGEDGSLNLDLTFTLTFEDEDTGEPVETDFAGFLACYVAADGEADLVVTHLGLAELWDQETDAREDVLATLSLTGEAVTPDEEPDTTAGDEESEADAEVLGRMTDIQGDGDVPANADDLLQLFQTSITDINDYWTREYPLISGGQAYEPPTEFIPWVGDIDTPCGTATSFDIDSGSWGDGPFFCPPNNTIYLDMGFANYQFQQVGEIPFLIPVVLAHEVGHHVQDILGMDVCYQTPCLDPNVLTSQEIEYMADCYAGSWSRDAELRGRLGAEDIEANIIQYVIILGGGQEGADPGGHGRGSERIWWFLNGYIEGAKKCYETSNVTASWAQTGPPNAQVSPTPEATEEQTDNPTETADDLAALGETLETSDGTFSATSAVVQDSIEDREADGEFLVVFADVFPNEEADGLPFDYEAWSVVDADGNVYEIDLRATDLLLSSAYEDGIDEELVADSGYAIGLVFDVDPDASGLILVNESEDIQIDLDL